jgi:hypothetical protein
MRQTEVLQPEEMGTSAEPDSQAAARRCLAAGWRWIHRNLDLFTPADPFDPDGLKQFSELALLYGCAVAWSGDEARTRLGTIEEFLLGLIVDPALAQQARKRVVLFNPYFVAYLSLRSGGLRIDDYEQALEAAERAGYPDSMESTPYRELEMQHIMWRSGLREERPRVGQVYSGTVLARCRNPIHLHIPAVYSITHTLFYLNDYAGPPVVLNQDEIQRATEMVEALFVHYWRKQDWDLVSELALNLLSLDRADTPLFAAGVGALFRAWESRSDGALLGPTFVADDVQSTPDYEFEKNYHTTLVGILFCEAFLHRSEVG